MKLTAKQERMVRDFIRGADASAEALPPATQQRVKSALRQRLRKELSAFGEEIPGDEQVEAILQRCRVPGLSIVEGRPSGTSAPAPEPEVETLLKPESSVAPASTVKIATATTDDRRIWAGVCAAWADRLGVEPMIVRGGFVLVGLVMPPLAFLAYLAGYVELLVRSDRPVVPSAESGTLFLRGFSTAMQVIALFLIGYFVPRLAIDLSMRFLPELNVQLGAWGWFQGMEWSAFWFTLFLAVPMRVVSALPLLHDWDKTLDLLTRLVVALYALLISFGIASGITGAAIEIIEFLTR